jgi:hypothetical protein
MKPLTTVAVKLNHRKRHQKYFCFSLTNSFTEVVNDRIFSVVHFIRSVLATGAAGFHTLSDRMANIVAVSNCWNRRGRRAGIALVHRDSARSAPARPACLKLIDFSDCPSSQDCKKLSYQFLLSRIVACHH